MKPKFAARKSVLLQSVKGRLSVHDQLFCRHQYRGNLHGVTRKLDLDQSSMAHKQIERHKCDETHFLVRSHDFLQLSPVNSALYGLNNILFTHRNHKYAYLSVTSHSALYVVIMFVWVSLCRFLQLTCTSYRLVAHFDLA